MLFLSAHYKYDQIIKSIIHNSKMILQSKLLIKHIIE